jgi:trimeric autotransporter adhesin
MKRVHAAFCFNLAISILCCAAVTQAQQPVATATNAIVPPLVSFSGVLVDASGKALATETVGVTFSLYQDQQGGAALWVETQNVQPDATGHYSVTLGAATSAGLPSSLFATGAAHWLGVKPQGQQEEPRVLLVSAPYALKAGDAETIGGLPPSAFQLAALGASSSGSASLASATVAAGQTGKPPQSGSGTANFIPIWTSSTVLGNSEIFQTAGNVGVNTLTPASTMDVAGFINTSTSYSTGYMTGLSLFYETLLATPGGVSGGNTAVNSALLSNTTGIGNTASGYQSLLSNTTGNDNTASGASALSKNTTGSQSLARGSGALFNSGIAANNTASGYQALFNSSGVGTYNTADGSGALFSNATAQDNTGEGFQALHSNTSGGENTARGFQALFSNTTAANNTAEGYQALFSNTTGADNTATGSGALFSNTVASDNTASGFKALFKDTTGSQSTATGFEALFSNTSGSLNTATGAKALLSNTLGTQNTATGLGALQADTTGGHNTASGSATMQLNTTGAQNTAFGAGALSNNTSGNNNIAIGFGAAMNVSGGNSNNIHIGSVGNAGDNGTIRIGTSGAQTAAFVAGVSGVTTGNNDAISLMIDSNGQLGTVSSSRRFKEDIQDMGDASRGLMLLHPVTFRYQKPYVDGSKPNQYGLIAEEVDEVYPDLVAHSADGQIETVKYQVLDPMLLNEVQRQQAEIQDLQKQLNEDEMRRQQAEIEVLQERFNKMKAVLASLSCGAGTP